MDKQWTVGGSTARNVVNLQKCYFHHNVAESEGLPGDEPGTGNEREKASYGQIGEKESYET